MNMETVNQVKLVLNRVRPFLQADGGDVEFVKFENGIVYVKLLGACIGCSSADLTLRDGIEALLLEEVPGVVGVQQVLD